MLQKTLRRTTKCKTAKITKAKQNIPNIKLTVNVRVLPAKETCENCVLAIFRENNL